MHSILTRFKVLAGIALLALLAACSGAPSGGDTLPEDQPRISISAAVDTVAPEATLRLTAALSGSGASEADIHWSATGGQLSPETGAEVDWTAPAAAGQYEITAHLGADGTGASDSITITVAEAGSGGPGGNDGDDGDDDSGKDDDSDDGDNSDDDPAEDDENGDDSGNDGDGDDNGKGNDGDDGDDNGNGNGDASTPGSLQITIDSSLPGITVTVSGPDGYSTVVTSSGTLEDLEPGEYEFTAPAIDRSYGVYAARFEPADRVVVKPAESADVTVSSHPGPVVTVIDDSDNATQAGSLRYLLRLAADNAPDIKRIEFDPDVFSGPDPVVIVGSQLTIASGLDLTISASEDNPVELRRGNTGTPGRVLEVEDEAHLVLSNLKLNGNSQTVNIGDAIARGGVILNAGQLSLDNVSVENGAAQSGGGIYSEDQLKISHSIIASNRATSDGGGVYARGSVEIEQSGFTGNRNFSGSGGGLMLHQSSELQILDSTFADNEAGESGGGIGTDRNATTTITGSTFSGNRANGKRGGGAWINGPSQLARIVNSTFTENHSAADGGAIGAADDLTVQASTIVGNSSDTVGAGISANADGFSLVGSIVADNSGTSDLYLNAGATKAVTYNLIGTAGGLGASGLHASNQTDIANPGLQILKDNGGPTRTMRPAPTSLALDFIPGAQCTSLKRFNQFPSADQRGFSRPGSSGECDAGAVEVQ